MNAALARASAFWRERLWRWRFARFLVVGFANTLFGYALFFVLLRGGMAPTAALALATLLGVAFNFVTTGRVVFDNGDPWRLWRFSAAYGVVFVVNAVALETAVAFGVDAAIAQATLLPFCVALSYVLNRTLVFNGAAREA